MLVRCQGHDVPILGVRPFGVIFAQPRRAKPRLAVVMSPRNIAVPTASIFMKAVRVLASCTMVSGPAFFEKNSRERLWMVER